MSKNKIKAPAFDEIIFEFRNREYGAYVIRKKYNRNVLIALLIGILIISTATIGPYIKAKNMERTSRADREEIQVELVMENLDIPDEFAPPPPPPPPPPDDVVEVQARYVPPVIVDSIKPEEEVVQFMAAADIQEIVQNVEVTEEIQVVTTQAVQEVVDDREEIPQFVVVEEMPMYPGGDAALLSYIGSNIVYPEKAKENNIQGRVFLQFVVTSRGNIGEVRVLRGVDPELDAEAVRVIQTITGFRPGRQGGVAVPVWYQVPVTYQLR